jgi:hypothetical protein
MVESVRYGGRGMVEEVWRKRYGGRGMAEEIWWKRYGRKSK